MPVSAVKKRFTYNDYMTWAEGERWELLDGQPVMMEPSPGRSHQRVSRELMTILNLQLKDRSCEVFAAPMDVVLSDTNVVQPDVFIVCDPAKSTEKAIRGAPDVVFEIVSSFSSTRDKREKKRIYQKYDVKEYILVTPKDNNIERFLLQEDGVYSAGEILDRNQPLKLKAVDDVVINLWEVFKTDVKHIRSEED